MNEARWGCFRHGVHGCNHTSAANYNGAVTDPEDDACIEAVYGCTNSSALNHNPNATLDDGSCDRSVLGCTDRNATNYASTATVDDAARPASESRMRRSSDTRAGRPTAHMSDVVVSRSRTMRPLMC